MFDFGIEGYRPQWLSGRGEVLREHRRRLRALCGRPLTGFWMAWDLDDDEWFCDCPVLLDFAGEQVEVNHHEFDEVSLTWSTIDPGRSLRWAGFDLQWRSEPLPEVQALCGLPLQRVELLGWMGKDAAHGAVDVSFVFPDGRVSVFNALDENGLDFARPSAEQHPYTVH
ncbi:hypothetical protein [Streptomyces noursei]|uniref:hypothetical protein n=1 Tax=Streptomyces noursei TaxID=1971 RepID=UPI001671C73B|nr:hypothetical protein [Streptomyces noursei]MCZ1020148.1 hypothetical protein [Streptomyces noursei]GGX40075.1 hypothetical protein GCM10010341_72570 [Streptomyces noursei]